MLTLYIRSGCPYSKKVLEAGEALGVSFTAKNIADEGVEEELIARGGKHQVPFLVDEETGASMYDADLIIGYLHSGFTKHT